MLENDARHAFEKFSGEMLRRTIAGRAETRQITIQRTFPDFEDFWVTTLEGSIIGPGINRLAPAERQELQSRMRARLGADAAGRVTYASRANAVKGVVP